MACDILYPADDIKDESGCINEDCDGEHTCIDIDGVKWHWKEDVECGCGCWDEYLEYGGHPCLIYGHA